MVIDHVPLAVLVAVLPVEFAQTAAAAVIVGVAGSGLIVTLVELLLEQLLPFVTETLRATLPVAPAVYVMLEVP